MRTFPKSLAAFQQMVEERGKSLRGLSYNELKTLSRPTECITVDGRPAEIGVHVNSVPNGGVQVLVQGFLENAWMPGKSVALDGFTKYPDETLAPLTDKELYKFG